MKKKHSRLSKIVHLIKATLVGDRLADFMHIQGLVLIPCSGGYKALSPFNRETVESFFLFFDWWSDFSGAMHRGGDVIKFVMLHRKVGFQEAVRILAKHIGIAIPDDIHGDWAAAEKREAERQLVCEILTKVTLLCHEQLTPEIRERLKRQWGLDGEVISRFKIGLAIGGLYRRLRAMGYSREALLKTGLFFVRRADQLTASALGRMDELEEGGLVEDFLVDCIIFAHWDSGSVNYLAGRTINDVTPSNPKFKKLLTHSEHHTYVSETVQSSILNIDDARGAEILLVCEGYCDCVAAVQAGHRAISPGTTHFARHDIERLVEALRHVPKVIIIFDSEVNGAGAKGAAALAATLHAAGIAVYIATLPLPEGASKTDVADYLRDNPREEFDKVIANALPFVDYILDRVPATTPATELEGALADAMKAIAVVPSDVTKDHHVKTVAKKFGLRRALVEGMLKKAIGEVEAARKAKAAAEARAEREENEADHADGAGNADAGDGQTTEGASTPKQQDEKLPWEDPSPSTVACRVEHMKGSVLEDLKRNFYFIEERTQRGSDGDTFPVKEAVSNFRFLPKIRIISKYGERFRGDVITTSGKIHRNVEFALSDFNNSRTFLKAFPTADMAWTGRDPHVQGLLHLLSRANVPIIYAVEAIGYHLTQDGPLFVAPDVIVAADDPEPYADLALVTTGSPLNKLVRFEMPPWDEACALARRALPDVLRINEPQFVLPVLGWFFASPYKAQIMGLHGHFALLAIWGTQSSGKTSTLKYVFWPLLGVPNTDLFSCTDTEFSLIKLFSSTNSVPIILDELKPADMDQRKLAMLLRYFRRIYSGEQVLRGRPDLTTVSFELSAPVAFAGEARPENDPALLERLISASSSPNALATHFEYREAFARLRALDLSKLAGWYARFTLRRDLRAELAKAEQETDTALQSILHGDAATPRMRDNLAIAVLGVRSFQAFAHEMGVTDLPAINILDALKSTVLDLVDGESGSRSDLDRFLEGLSILSLREDNVGGIVEGRDYRLAGERLYIHLPSCWALYREYLRRTGQQNLSPDEGLKALRRLIRENHERRGYVVEISRTVKMDGDRRTRTIVVDLDLAGERLIVDGFPQLPLHAVRYDPDRDGDNVVAFQKGVYPA